jgi:voltage-gated potassium channel Kch
MARLRYAFDTTMSRGVSALIIYLGLIVAIAVALFAVVVHIFDLGPTNNPIRTAYNALLHTIDTGTIAGDTGTGYEIAALFITIVGLFLFSAFIGILATVLDEQLTNLRKGRSLVLETGHALILGWSERVFTIISELAIANESEGRKRPSIVVLADRDKVEMEDTIRERVPALRGTRVVCRTGRPTSVADLELVAHRDAASVIVLGLEADEQPDAGVVKAILALTTDVDVVDTNGRHIVAEIEDAANIPVARLAGGEGIVLVDKPETISRLIVQTSRQLGASAVYQELLDFDGEEIYMRIDPALAGRTYRDALHAYETCTVIGLLRADGGVKLNVPPDTVLAAGDAVIAIALDNSELDLGASAAGAIDEQRIVDAAPTAPVSDATLVLGYNHRAPIVLSELADYAGPDSRVVVVADVAAEHVALPASNGLPVSYTRGSTTDRAVLDGLDIPTYDRVIVLAYSDDLDIQQADARSLVTLLHLRDIAERTGGEFTIVSELLDPDNADLARTADVDDIIVSDQVLSLMLAQLSQNRHLADVFGELFQADGAEVYLRPAGRYATGDVSFATLVEAAARRGETAIGYRDAAHSHDPDESFGVIVNPPKSARIQVADGDRLIVLAEE